MNEATEIRLRLMEMVGRDGGDMSADQFVQTVLGLERFVWDAGVAKPEAAADSAVSETDRIGTT